MSLSTEHDGDLNTCRYCGEEIIFMSAEIGGWWMHHIPNTRTGERHSTCENRGGKGATPG